VGIFKQPKPPDPYETASAQAAQNKETAIASQTLNMIDQDTPTGSLTYTKIGEENGVPRYKATQTLAAPELAALNQQRAFDATTNQLAVDQAGRLQTHLSQPVDINNETTEARLFGLGRKRLDPLFAERRASQEADLMNRGISVNSDAYRSAQRSLGEQENDAFNNLLLSGRQQAVSEALQERNQPINEITALMSGQQITNPLYASTPQTSVANTDLAGMIYKNYDNKVAGQQAMLGGLFGLGGTVGRLAFQPGGFMR
jgi:hypothetical protein